MKRAILKYIFTAILLVTLPFVFGMGAAPEDPHMFGIYTSTLDGKNFKRIISDSYREMNHARVSPDKKWITFSRFNKRGRDNLAKEMCGSNCKTNNRYEETEIVIVRIDGTGLKSIVPPEKGKVAVNSYWTPDGKGLLYFSTIPTSDNILKVKMQINHIDLAAGKITPLPIDNKLTDFRFGLVDPHQVKNSMVVSLPALDENPVFGL